MTLRRAEDIEVEQRGAWFFRSVVITTPNATFSLRGRRLREVEEQRVGGAALVGESRGRRLWWVGDGFYWDADGLDAEHVALEVWDRARRREHRYDRLRTIRAREDEATTTRRERIPEEVRILVWARDEGRCVRCGAEDELQFDHVIPVAKGGGNAQENIQILCGSCNRSKSDHIA